MILPFAAGRVQFYPGERRSASALTLMSAATNGEQSEALTAGNI